MHDKGIKQVCFAVILLLSSCIIILGVSETNQQKDYIIINDVAFEGDTLIKYPSWKTDTCYTIPSGVKRIGDCAFDNADIERIFMSDEVVEIGIAAFEGWIR